MSVLTVYPSADANFNQFQGDAGSDWATIRAAAGNEVDTSTDNVYVAGIWGNATNWRRLYRAGFVFDTSALGAGIEISAAKFCLYGSAKGDNLTITPDINIYNFTPTDPASLAAADYAQTGGTTPTAYSTAITYANWSITGYNEFALNAAGLEAISKTGNTKISTRNANYDASGNAPGSVAADSCYLYAYMVEKLTTYRPYLEITYTVPVLIQPPAFNINILMAIPTIVLKTWVWATKNIATWTGGTKHNSTFTNKTKNSSTWTSKTKN